MTLTKASVIVAVFALLGLLTSLGLVADRRWQVSIETGIADRDLRQVFLATLQDQVEKESVNYVLESEILVVSERDDEVLQVALGRAWAEAEKAVIGYATREAELLDQATLRCSGKESGCIISKDLDFLAHERALESVKTSLKPPPDVRAEIVPRGYGPTSPIVVLAGFAGGAGAGVFIAYILWARDKQRL